MSKCTTNCNQGRSCQCGPVVIKTARGPIEWIAAVFYAALVECRRRIERRALNRRIESLECLHNVLLDELSTLRSEKFRSRFMKTPTLDARIEAAQKEFDKVGNEIDSAIERYHLNSPAKPTFFD